MTRIGLLSDTHAYWDEKYLEYFEPCDEIWHAGDIGSLEVAEKLAAFRPFRAVYGNIDGQEIRKLYPQINRFTVDGAEVLIKHIGGYPGKYDPSIIGSLMARPPKLFISGHSHILKVKYDKTLDMLHINPGAAGMSGFHKVRTLVRFVINQGAFQDLEVIELADKVMEDEEYKKELKHLQKKLGELHNRLYRKRVPVIITYEGWDAAGKGGNIKRITEALDPRGFGVHPIASPEPHEKARHYLWRFWTRLPKDGHIAIFDRTWYGRVMVERLEGFCSENDWKRAYNEINEFEKELSDWGAVIIKLWVQIDKDTQLARFTDRQNNPEKQWKITDEDWRNREKWDAYETAVDEMLTKTSTAYAPWHILESVDKKYARIKALKIVIKELEKVLG